MFKRLVLVLQGPICACEQQNLGWGIDQTENTKNNEHSIYIQCNTCNTILRTSSPLVAYIQLEIQYPKGILKSSQTVSEWTEDDKKLLRDFKIRLD